MDLATTLIILGRHDLGTQNFYVFYVSEAALCSLLKSG
jgi:hypothetical protein